MKKWRSKSMPWWNDCRLAPLRELTNDDHFILKALGYGKSVEDIASEREPKVKGSTVRVILHKMRRRLNAKSTHEMVVRYFLHECNPVAPVKEKPYVILRVYTKCSKCQGRLDAQLEYEISGDIDIKCLYCGEIMMSINLQ